jgi:hypothetical protein
MFKTYLSLLNDPNYYAQICYKHDPKDRPDMFPVLTSLNEAQAIEFIFQYYKNNYFGKRFNL